MHPDTGSISGETVSMMSIIVGLSVLAFLGALLGVLLLMEFCVAKWIHHCRSEP